MPPLFQRAFLLLSRSWIVLGLTWILALFYGAGPFLTAASAETNSPTAVSPSDLDESIEGVLQRSEFAWRMPREEIKDSPAQRTTWYARAVGAVVDVIKDIVIYAKNGLADALKWIGRMILKLWPANSSSSDPSGLRTAWQSTLQILLLLLIMGIASLLAVLIIRLWRRRRRPESTATPTLAAMPDLNDENIAADQLPEDEWLKMARDLMAQGNLRLALRALYLAGLSHLATRELIALAKFKSNRDYEAELLRRARAHPAVQSAFCQNVAIIERVWYGLHEVTQEALQQFQSNLEQIRAC